MRVCGTLAHTRGLVCHGEISLRCDPACLFFFHTPKVRRPHTAVSTHTAHAAHATVGFGLAVRVAVSLQAFCLAAAGAWREGGWLVLALIAPLVRSSTF